VFYIHILFGHISLFITVLYILDIKLNILIENAATNFTGLKFNTLSRDTLDFPIKVILEVSISNSSKAF
jgi:hypothetical protein